ncbi:glycoside hydrolase family 43 protein [Geopyxis carbonaria]|nr:glycoside hydrolase family 43 protein [Geopyxis carbonaria]
MRFLSALSLAVLSTAALASPAPKAKSDPFSADKWPLPAKVFGDTAGWATTHVHDPSLIKHGGHYYSFSTHLQVGIARSPTLHGPWTHLGSVISGQSAIDLPGRDDLWAPDVVRVGDTFYCYYSVSTFGSQNSAIGVATSKTLLPGSWTDHGAVLRSYDPTEYPAAPSPNNITNAIDPAVYADKRTGKPWIAYGSFWSNIWSFPLAKSLKTTAAAPAAVHVAYDPESPNPVEGPYVHQASNGWSYLFVSHGVCCGYNTSMPDAGKEYKIKVGRARSPQGPFLDRDGVDMKEGGGSVVFGSHGYVYGPGGQGVLVDGKKDILYYHYVDTRVSYVDEDKLLGWNEIKYVDGWPVLM